MDVMFQADKETSGKGGVVGYPDTAQELGRLLGEYRGGAVTVLDLRELNGWTDFFVIATVTSNTHLQGLERHIKEFAQDRDLEILTRSRKPETGEEEWRLIDLGPLVIHLMTDKARAFYELERLWSAAPVIYQGGQAAEPPYSSKSSYSASSS